MSDSTTKSVRVDPAERTREFYRKQGEQRELQRILQILETTPFIWAGDLQLIQTSRNELIKLIKGETK
jgi:hypothetical protein